MKNKPYQQIAKRLLFYIDTEQLPDEAIRKAHEHYENDVAFLLGELDRLQANERQFLDICTEMNAAIEQLRGEKETLQNKLRQMAEKFDLNKEIFSPPRNSVITEPSRKPRLTDNRPPQPKP